MTPLKERFKKALTEKAFQSFFQTAESVTFFTGDVIHRHKQPVDDVFILEEGGVDIIVPITGQTLTTIREPGSFLGWSCMVGREVASATLECCKPTKLIRFSKNDLDKVFQKHPKAGLIFYKELSREIGERLTASYEMLSLLLGEVA